MATFFILFSAIEINQPPYFFNKQEYGSWNNHVVSMGHLRWKSGTKVWYDGTKCRIRNLSAIAKRPCGYSQKGLRL